VKIKTSVLTFIFAIIIVAVLVIGTYRLMNGEEQKKTMPSAAEMMERAQGRGK